MDYQASDTEFIPEYDEYDIEVEHDGESKEAKKSKRAATALKCRMPRNSWPTSG